MGEAGIRQAVEVVTRIPDERIRQVIAENGGSHALDDRMLARKADMAGRLAPCRIPPPPSPTAPVKCGGQAGLS